MDGLYWFLVVMAIIIIFIIVFVFIPHMEDTQLEIRHLVSKLSCEYMKKDLAFEEQKNFKHPWYDEMKTQYAERCQ